MSHLQYSSWLNTLLLTKSEKSTNMVVSNLAQRFSEDVAKVAVRWNVFHRNIAVLDTLMYVVVTDVDVFNSGVVFCIPGESNCARVISI